MTNCFQCGGALKLIAKPGRTVYDLYTANSWEIPRDLSITTCLECGFRYDWLISNKLVNVINSQKSGNHSPKLMSLRQIDSFIHSQLLTPMDPLRLEGIILSSLLFRENIYRDISFIEIESSFMKWLEAVSISRDEMLDFNYRQELVPVWTQFTNWVQNVF